MDSSVGSCDECYFQIDYQGNIGKLCRLGHKFNGPEYLKCRKLNEGQRGISFNTR